MVERKSSKRKVVEKSVEASLWESANKLRGSVEPAEYNALAVRIETNKKLIATLEQTAQTLFKKWSLESLHDSLFDDVAKIVMGQSPEGDFVNKEGLGEPLLNGPTEFGLFSPTPVQWTTTPKKMCEEGDVLFLRS